MDEYVKWIGILEYLCHALNESLRCPHPRIFVRYKLRQEGVWSCADVEMALHAFAKALEVRSL
ncbi:MAG: hypothetical protein H0Z28_12325 [Archaeoglobus sp.]|nr:hypothetical protein [Archaeoglobus sp.]